MQPPVQQKTKPTEGNKPHDSAVPKTPVVLGILNRYRYRGGLFVGFLVFFFLVTYAQYTACWIKTLKQLCHFHDSLYI